MAVGVLLAAAAAAGAAVAVLTLAALRLMFSGDGRLSLDGLASVLLAASFAATYAAMLAVPTRFWSAPRHATLVLAFVVSLAWPQSGYRLPAAVVATVAVGLSLARDRRCPSDRRVRGGWTATALAAAAAILGVTGLAMATTYPLHPAAARPSSAPKLDLGAGSSPFAPTAPRPAPSAAPREAAPATPSEAAPTTPPEATPSEATTPEATPAAPSSPEAAPAAPPEAPTPEATPAAPSSPDATPTAPPAATPSSPEAAPATPHAATAGAGAFVRDYYASLDARRFEDAWARLSPTVRAAFGGFERWRAGFARTVSSSPGKLVIATQGELVTVRHRLLARDRGCAATKRFSVTWTLRRVSGKWSVVSLRGSALDTARCG